MDHHDTKLVGVLPSSFARESKNVIRGHFPGFGFINWKQIFCYNCGKYYGRVPEETCNFACWLCDPCSEKWGEQFGLLKSPDEVFWKKCEEIMMEKYGRVLTPQEIEMLSQDTGALAKLLREGT